MSQLQIHPETMASVATRARLAARPLFVCLHRKVAVHLTLLARLYDAMATTPREVPPRHRRVRGNQPVQPSHPGASKPIEYP
jgi:hypothetical protein